MLVVIESPFAGNRNENMHYGKRALLDSLRRGESPFASHLLYTQVLDDAIKDDRELGIIACLRFYPVVSLCAVYNDMGISPGMFRGIDAAKAANIPIEYRSIGLWSR